MLSKGGLSRGLRLSKHMGAPEVPGKSPHLSGRHQAPKLARHHRAQRGEHICTVEAPDRERAEVAAVKLFDLDHAQRSRL
jgi:hypothetical protein